MTPTIAPTRMTAWLEQAWLVRYLNRRLSGEEVTWFESYLLDKPDLLAMVDADTRLRDALAADASARHSDGPAESAGRQGKAPAAGSRTAGPALGPRRGRRATDWLGLAASLAIGVGLGWLGERGVRSGRDAAIVGSPTRIVFDTLREDASPPRIEHGDSRSAYVLVEVALPPDAERIALQGPGDANQPLSLSPDGFVSFLLERSRIDKSQPMQIRYVRGGNAAEKTIDLTPVEL